MAQYIRITTPRQPGVLPLFGFSPSACRLKDVLNHATANGTAHLVLTKIPTIGENPSADTGPP
jgi:hypothetical protein